MELLGSIAIRFFALPLLFFGGIIVLAARRGFQMKLLVQDGTETTGTVVRKLTFSPYQWNAVRRIRYEYRDQFGTTHSNRSTVPDDVYRSCEEGGPFSVVYSQSKPQISAPKYLVDQSRAALEKRSSGASAGR